MNKKLIGLSILLFLVISGALSAQNTIALDEAIQNGAEAIVNRLNLRVKVAVLNFNSPSARFSNYVLDELMAELVNSGKITVVDRASLDLIRQEMDFQMSGEVSDASAQSIGQMLGAQSIISGSIENMGTHYRIRFRAIEVETAAIQIVSSFNIRNDAQVATLMGNQSPQGTARTPAAAPSSPALAPAPHPKGLNYSTGRKVGAGFLNTLFGIGSFTMGDWLGGSIIGVLELTGAILFVSGYDKRESARYDLDSLGVTEARDAAFDSGHSIMVTGITTYAIGAIAGFVLPFTYDITQAKKQGTYMSFDASSNPIQHISLSPVPTKTGIGMGLLFSASY